MDPYAVLGITPSAAPEQVEAAYRAQLRAWHPDLHQHAGPQAIAEAEARTRALNEAMARIRGGWRPPAAATGAARRPPAPGRGGFGTDGRPGTAVPCPFCGAPFADLGTYEHHLATAHRVQDLGPRRRRGGSRLVQAVGTLRWVPAWLVALLVVATVLYAPLEWWLVPLCLLALVLWAQTRPRDRWR